jgi:hypothetical protein
MVSREIDNGENVLVRFRSIEARTAMAYKILTPFSDEASARMAWLPKSQVADIDEEKGEVWIPLWLAEKKGLGYE